MKKVLVTGATGFIGFHVLKELRSRGIDVVALVRNNSKNIDEIKSYGIEIVYSDIKDYRNLSEILKSERIDTIFHFAWQGVADSDSRNEDVQIMNIKATLQLIEVAKNIGAGTFIGAGSIHELEAISELKENKTMNNMNLLYKASKLMAHISGKAKAGHYGIRFFWPVITNAYGEGELSGRLINTVIRNVLEGKTTDLTQGKQIYDFIYVTDLAKAFCLIAEKGIDGRDYTIGSGTPQKLRKYLEVVEKIANQYHSLPYVHLGFGRSKENAISLPLSAFDISDLEKDTGFQTEVTFERGILRTVQWIKDMKDQDTAGIGSLMINAGGGYNLLIKNNVRLFWYLKNQEVDDYV